VKKDAFFEAMAAQCLALTYDDVRLKTGHSEVMPRAVDITSRFSRNVGLKCPIVSSPMDTVTESLMAIAMAMAGGLGIIHRNLTAEQQAAEVARVKSHLNALILKPVCVKPEDTIRQVEAMRESERLPFHSFPVVSAEGKFVGLVTKTDFDLCTDPEMAIAGIMSRDVFTAIDGTSLEEAFRLMSVRKKKVLPLVDREKRLMGMYVTSDIRRIKSGSQNGYNTDSNNNLRVGAAISTGESELERAQLLLLDDHPEGHRTGRRRASPRPP